MWSRRPRIILERSNIEMQSALRISTINAMNVKKPTQLNWVGFMIIYKSVI